MNISMLNFDSSFFNIQVDGTMMKDNKILDNDISGNVISLEIVEEMGKMISGNLQILDPENIYSHELKLFRKLYIRWGYKNKDYSNRMLLAEKANSTEMYSPKLGIATRAITAVVTAPSGNGGDDGTIIYNCSFMAYDNRWKTFMNKVHNGTTKLGVIATVLNNMKVYKQFISFRRGNDKVNGDTAIRQDGMTDFKFLHKLSLEWRCLFRIGYDENDTAVALFCDYDNDTAIRSFVESVNGCIGFSSLMEYKIGKGNVKSYSWQHNVGEAGDSVQAVQGPNGKVQFWHMKAETNTITYYKLNPEQIEADLKKQGYSASAVAVKMMEMLKIDNMDELIKKRYFVPVEASTAPQGLGLTMDIETIGDPFCTAPARVKFGRGFPSLFTDRYGILFYAIRVNHKIDRSGYSNSIHVGDALTISGGSLVQ